jgi:hypothetical protein
MLEKNLKRLSPHLNKAIKGGFAFVMTVFTITFIAYNVVQNRKAIKNSQTPIGETLQFVRSGANVKVKNYYTDKAEDVIIATLEVQEGNSKLPTKASDYWVVTTSDIGGRSIPTYFGRMNTDGDFFIIIPYPKNQTYTVAIYNTTTSGGAVTSSGDQITIGSGTNSKIVSDITSDLLKNVNKSQVQGVKQTDIIALNMTLKSSIQGDSKYAITTLDVDSLLSKEGDTVAFDFKKFYTLAYRDLAVTVAREKVNTYTEEIQALNDKLKEVRETLDRNPKDEVALRQQDSINASIEQAQENLEKANQTLNEIKKRFVYDDNTFSDYTTKMYSLN